MQSYDSKQAEIPATSEGLNFESPDVGLRVEDGVHLIPSQMASGLSVAITIVFLFCSVFFAKIICAAEKKHTYPKIRSPSLHVVSFFLSSFLALNVFFGGLTAFLLNGKNEDAQSYFAEISALKLARLSHEHFFGYGILFSAIALLGLFFVGHGKKRILIPVFLSFSFGALDVISWWLTRYISFGFHTLSFITGSIFATSFLAIYLQVVFVNLCSIKERA